MILLISDGALASGWKEVFVDQFNGTALNRERWATRYIYGNGKLDHLNDEKQHYRDNRNHVVEDGILSLVARPSGDGKFESGMIRSRQTFYYGYFETRVFLPRGRGVWPAFWLNPDYDGEGKLNWPPEIDVFEYAVNGRDDTDTMFHSAASAVGNDKTISYLATGPGYSTRLRRYDAGRPLNQGWHVFGMVWTPNRISIFLDGHLVFARAYRWSRRDGTLGGPAHILLNFAVGGSWAGRYGIDTANFPQSFRIDYVRVCQFTAGSEGQRSCGNSAFTPDPARFGYRSAFSDLHRPVIGRPLLSGGIGASQGEQTVKTGGTIGVNIPLTMPPGFKDLRQARLTLRWPSGKPIVERTVSITPQDQQSLRIELPIPAAGLSRKLRYPLTIAIGSRDAPARAIPLTCQQSRGNHVPERSCELATLRISP